MAIPTTKKECTTRRIASLIIGLWDKVKNAFQPKLPTTGTPSSTYSIGITGNASTSDYPSGFNNRGTTTSWGTVKESNGYTTVTRWATNDSAEIVMGKKSGALSVQIDGMYYQNEGQYQVLDASSRGAANGVASLDSDGKVPTSQLPTSEFHPSVFYGYSLIGTFNLTAKGLLELQINCSRDVNNGISINACIGVGNGLISTYYTSTSRVIELAELYRLAYKLASNDNPSGDRVIEIWLIDNSQPGQYTRRCGVRVMNSSNSVTYTVGSQSTQTSPSNLINFDTSCTKTTCTLLNGINGNRKFSTWTPQRGDDNPFICRSGFYNSLLRINSGNTVATGKWVDINLSNGVSILNGGIMLYISTCSSNNPACYVLECSAFKFGSARLTVRGDLYNGFSGHINNFYLRTSNGSVYLFFKIESECTVKIASDGDLDINKVTISDTAPGDTSNPVPSGYHSSTVPSYYYNKRYSYAKGQVGGPSTPVYVNSSGEIVACTNVPAIEHVTSIPSNPTVGTIYAL